MNKEWNEVADCLHKAKQARKYYENLESHYLWAIKRLSGGLPATGDVFELRAVVRPGSIDYEKIIELQSIDVNQYRKAPVTSWVLRERIVLPKEMEELCSQN